MKLHVALTLALVASASFSARAFAAIPFEPPPVTLYSSFLGGSGEDNVGGMHVDATGIWIGGNTTSTDLPTPNGEQPNHAGSFDAYVAKLDPTGTQLLFATYFGGSGEDVQRDLVVDANGDAYLLGETDSTDLPVTVGAFDTSCGDAGACGGLDTFVAKFDGRDGSLLWATYLGGAGSDVAGKLAVDADSNAYVSGYTNSTDLPATEGAYDETCGTDGSCDETCVGDTCTKRRDCFAAKLAPDGASLGYLTYLGGSGFDRCFGGGVDADGRAVVVGSTFSPDFPATEGAYDESCGTDGACNGADDAFAAMLDGAGASLVYATFLGGSGNGDAQIDEYAWAVDVAADGRARLVGQTDSSDFPTPNGADTTFGGNTLDGFVADLDPSGATLAFASFLGGNGIDQGYDVAVDALGRIIVTGATTSTDLAQIGALPGPGNVCQFCDLGFTEAFVATLDPSGGSFLFSTYLGGSSSDYGTALALEGENAIWIGGDAASTDFPIVAGAFQPVHGGAPEGPANYDIFLTRVPEPSPCGVGLAAIAVLGAIRARRAGGARSSAAGVAHGPGSRAA